jgi:hypothetical protein
VWTPTAVPGPGDIAVVAEQPVPVLWPTQLFEFAVDVSSPNFFSVPSAIVIYMVEAQKTLAQTLHSAALPAIRLDELSPQCSVLWLLEKSPDANEVIASPTSSLYSPRLQNPLVRPIACLSSATHRQPLSSTECGFVTWE